MEEVNENINQEQAELAVPAEVEYKTMFQEGVQAYEKRDFSAAAKTFMEIYNKFPDQAEVLVNYGDCQYELLNTEEALRYWNMAKEKDKYLINPYINLGNYYMNNDDYEAAIKEYLFAFCLDPHNEMALVNLALSYERLNDKKKAFLLYEFYLAGNLNVSSTTYKNIHSKVAKHKLNAISQMKLGFYFEKKGYWRKSLQAYFDSMRVFPNFSKTYSNIGNIFFKSEKYDLAKIYWLEAYKMDRKNLKLILNLAICSEKTDDVVNAYAFYSKFIRRAKLTSSELQAAELSMQKSHERIVSDKLYLANYKAKADEYYNAGKFEDALVYYENLSILSSSNETIDRINKLQVETNFIHKSAYVTFQMAKELFEKGKYELAMEKCKVASSLWRNSFFEQDIRNLLIKSQTVLGNSINDMIKSKY